VYLAAAMVELRSNGDADKGLQVLELGRRYHPKDPNLACAAVDILVQKGDARNARALLQAALVQVDAACAPSLWERWMDLELRGSQDGGSIEAAEQIEWKRALALPGAYQMPTFASTDAALEALVQQAETDSSQGAPGMLPIVASPAEVASRGPTAAKKALSNLAAAAGGESGAPAESSLLIMHTHRHQHAGLLPGAQADEEMFALAVPLAGSVAGAASAKAGGARPIAWSIEAADGSKDYSGVGRASVLPSMREAESAAANQLLPSILAELPMAAVCHAGVSAGDSSVVIEVAEQGPDSLLGEGIRASS